MSSRSYIHISKVKVLICLILIVIVSFYLIYSIKKSKDGSTIKTSTIEIGSKHDVFILNDMDHEILAKSGTLSVQEYLSTFSIDNEKLIRSLGDINDYGSSTDENKLNATTHGFDVNNEMKIKANSGNSEEFMKYDIPKPKIHEKVHILKQPQLSSNTCNLKNLLIIFCMGTAQNVANRNAIRETWSAKNKLYNQNYKMISSYTYQVIFVIGRTNTNNRNLQKEISEEVAQHKDIIEVDFEESRYEYSRKFIASLNWLNSIDCKSLKFVLRVLDDVFVNVPPIFDWLNSKFISNNQQHSVYLGHIVKQDEPIRDIQHPMYTSIEDYPEGKFPDYIQSPLYLFSADVLSCFQNELTNIPIIPMEDAFIGLLANKCLIKPTHNEHFVLLGIPDNVCHHKKMFFIGNIEPIEMLKVFHNFEKIENVECNDIEENIEL